MATATQAGIASFFGGIARGLSARIIKQREQKEQEKAARLKMLGDITSAGLQAGTIKNPEESIAFLMNEYGMKDPKSQEQVKNLMRNATTVIPQFADKGTSPGTPIAFPSAPGGVQPPQGAPGSEAVNPALSRGPSPGRSIALREADPNRAPGGPQFYSADEMEQRSLEHARKLSDIEQKRQLSLEAAKGENQQKLAAMKVSKGTIMTGDEVPEGATTAQGGAITHDRQHRYQSYRMADGTFTYEPVEGKIDNSREGQLARAYRDLKSDDPDVKQAARDIIRQQQQAFVMKSLQVKTAEEKLELLQQTMPLTVQQLKDRVQATELLNKTREAVLSGDAKTQYDLAAAQAAKLVTEKGGKFYGQSAKEVTDTVLHQMGFDPDDIRDRIKPPSATAKEIADLTGGGNAAPTAQAPKGGPITKVDQVKWGSTPKDVQDVLKKAFQGPGIYTDEENKTQWKIDVDGSVTQINKKAA